MEQVTGLIETYCTFPVVEKMKLFRLTLFCFLIGNEDMHLKNFSIIRNDDLVTMSPAYDLLNTTIAPSNPGEESALPLHGKKNNLTRRDLVEYFGRDRLQLTKRVIDKVLMELQRARMTWEELLAVSFLSAGMKEKFAGVVADRSKRLF